MYTEGTAGPWNLQHSQAPRTAVRCAPTDVTVCFLPPVVLTSEYFRGTTHDAASRAAREYELTGFDQDFQWRFFALVEHGKGFGRFLQAEAVCDKYCRVDHLILEESQHIREGVSAVA